MEVVYLDKNIIVAVKPTGCISEEGNGSFPDMIKNYLLEIGEDTSLFTVHRLDRDVSGIMVYARNSKSAASLSTAIQNGTFVKEYDAVIHGYIGENGILEDYLFKDSKKNKVFVVDRQRKGVKYAKLQFTSIERNDNYQKIHIVLETGRTHQIRVQFASRKHPLLGDNKYGAKDEFKSIYLQSVRISFPDPLAGGLFSFEIKSSLTI